MQISKTIARELALEGADVAIVARGLPRLEQAARELSKETGRKIVPIQADTGSDDEVKAMVAQVAKTFGRIDILVINGAPSVRDGALDDVIKLFAEAANVKVLGYLRCARDVAPHMKRQGWGRIINIGGLAYRKAGAYGIGIRNAAITVITKNRADELGPSGINVTGVHPGATRTEATAGVLEAAAKQQGITVEELERKAFTQGDYANVIGKRVDSREIAYLVAFLASPKSIAISGDSLAAGGGVRGSIYY